MILANNRLLIRRSLQTGCHITLCALEKQWIWSIDAVVAAASTTKLIKNKKHKEEGVNVGLFNILNEHAVRLLCGVWEARLLITVMYVMGSVFPKRAVCLLCNHCVRAHPSYSCKSDITCLLCANEFAAVDFEKKSHYLIAVNFPPRRKRQLQNKRLIGNEYSGNKKKVFCIMMIIMMMYCTQRARSFARGHTLTFSPPIWHTSPYRIGGSIGRKRRGGMSRYMYV